VKSRVSSVFLVLLALTCLELARAADRPLLTIDDWFNWVYTSHLALSPDGRSLVIATERPDWDKEIFRDDLWLYRDQNPPVAPILLTQSERDSFPEWSPDGRWIAFLSGRKKLSGEKDADKDSEIQQLYVISANGGEAFAVTTGEDRVHAFAWSSDSRTLYFATRTPWSKAENEAYEKQWKDTEEYRESERGDVIFSIALEEALRRRAGEGARAGDEKEAESGKTPGAISIASTPFRVYGMAVSPDGARLVFGTEPISQRQEDMGDYELYLLDLKAAGARTPIQLTHNQALETELRWAPDTSHVFFRVTRGSVEGAYEDVQDRVYWLDVGKGKTERWAGDFGGAIEDYAVLPDGTLIFVGLLGTQMQLYTQATPASRSVQLSGWPGSYEKLAASRDTSRFAFVHSALQKPTEAFLAESAGKLAQARAATNFNQFLAERELPRGKPYRWTSTDGTPVEGMLTYPPGRFEAKNLPMFVLIHGGPEEANGEYWEGDWYRWGPLAATQGWLVFEPNYRGSAGYGDKFMKAIQPEIVSAPGKDILSGVDALVRDGIADPNRLTIGGYSYGGYMTNWLITQTTRFKAAVTGAGAVENASDWGNDDTTFDDAFFLGGRPWEVPKRYQDEAALFQMDKVRTPTHIVTGSDDIRVAVSQNYLLEHALHSLGIPSKLLIFPGEDHDLSENPWHGKIKIREELNWLQKYCPLTPAEVPAAAGAKP